MLISLSHRFVFVSNVRTAAAPLERALEPFAEIKAPGGETQQHMSWQQARTEYGFVFDQPENKPESFFRMGVLRDPVNRFFSSYHAYCLNHGDEASPRMGIREFWQKEEWLKWRKKEGSGIKRLQKSHFLDADGQCRFDLILPIDMLADYAPALFSRLGVNAELPEPDAKKTGAAKPKDIKPDDVKTDEVKSQPPVEKMPPDLAEEIREFWVEDYAFIAEMRARLKAAFTLVTAEVVTEGLMDVSDIGFAGKGSLWFVGTPHDLRGRVVAGPGLAADAQLVLVHPQGERAVTWGLPSPDVARRHADNPRAGHARFSLEA